jgi:hypothetical protein
MNIAFTVLIFIIVILLIIGLVMLYSKNAVSSPSNYKGMKSYQVLTPIKDDGGNMNLCPSGCVRGVCNKGANCKYDFQCQYCQDPSTNMFYVNFDHSRRILPVYAEEETLNYSEIQLLNRSIDKNNKYIDMLNDRIEMINS